MPATVRDAVLSRAARLRPSARAVLDAAAVAGPRIEPWLLQELTAAESGWIDECLATGVLCAQNGMFMFRHELAREAVLDALTPTKAMSLHRMVLQALQIAFGHARISPDSRITPKVRRSKTRCWSWRRRRLARRQRKARIVRRLNSSHER